MADVVSIVLEHTKQSDTRGALWTAVLVAAVTSRKAGRTRNKFAHTDELKHALCTLYASR